MFKDWTPGRTLMAIIIIGAIQGILYMIVIPPWWHYDEPGNFETVWLAANRPSWPQPGDYDENMRIEMAHSMLRYGWYDLRNVRPDFSGKQPVWIGVAQSSGQPGYYFVASLPLRLMHNADITIQYDAARFVSFLLYLLIIAVIWKAMGELVPMGHPLQWMVTVFIALLPAFVDTMISVNDDVAAVLVSSIFMWAGIRLIKRGFSFWNLTGLVAALVLCYFNKTTSWFAFILAPFVLIFSILRGRYLKLIVVLTAFIALLGAGLTLELGNPVSWFQSPMQSSPLRVKTGSAPLGNYAFQVDGSAENTPSQTMQFLSPGLVQSLRGKTLTLGEWIWSDQVTQVAAPYISFQTIGGDYSNSEQTLLNVDSKPAFYQTIFHVPQDILYARVVFQLPPHSTENDRVFMDGVTLAEGEFGDSAPQFSDPNGIQARWDGRNIRNLISNGSAEQDGLRVRPWVDKKTSQFLSKVGGNLPLIIATLQDRPGSGWYYLETASVLMRTFWASIAGDKLALPGNYANVIFVIVTILGLTGTLHLMWTKRRSIPWDVVYVLGMSFLIVWMFTVTRGVSSLLSTTPFSAWARYSYPAILPAALIICTGCREWHSLLKARFHSTDAIFAAIFLTGTSGLFILSIMNAVRYFHPVWWAFVIHLPVQ